MVSQSARSVLYCSAEKNFWEYAPAASAFSVSMELWTCSAAWSEMTRSTEPATAPMLNDFITARRDTESAVIVCALKLSLPGLVQQILRGSPRQCHDGQRGIFVRIGHERSGIGYKEILDLVRLAISVQYRCF